MRGHLLHAEGQRGGLLRSCSHVSILIWRASQKRRYSKSRKREKRRRHALDFATSPRFPIYYMYIDIRALPFKTIWLWKHLKTKKKIQKKKEWMVFITPFWQYCDIALFKLDNLTCENRFGRMRRWKRRRNKRRDQGKTLSLCHDFDFEICFGCRQRKIHKIHKIHKLHIGICNFDSVP